MDTRVLCVQQVRYHDSVQLRRAMAVIALIVGLAALAVGLIYLLVPAESLPSFFPGHLAGVHAKHYNRGDVGVLVGIVLVVIATLLARRPRGRHTR